MSATALEKLDWQKICNKSDLVEGGGVCALLGREQIAIFYLPNEEPPVYALHNFDPFGSANVLSRGIVGDIAGQLVVASPLYKQHFSLSTGACLEDEDTRVAIYECKLEGEAVSAKI